MPVRLGSELSPTLTITIVPEDDLPEFLAARERGEMVSAEDIMAEGFKLSDIRRRRRRRRGGGGYGSDAVETEETAAELEAEAVKV